MFIAGLWVLFELLHITLHEIVVPTVPHTYMFLIAFPSAQYAIIDDGDDYSDYSSALRGMSSVPEARQDLRERQVNLTPHARYIND